MVAYDILKGRYKQSSEGLTHFYSLTVCIDILPNSSSQTSTANTTSGRDGNNIQPNDVENRNMKPQHRTIKDPSYTVVPQYKLFPFVDLHGILDVYHVYMNLKQSINNISVMYCCNVVMLNLNSGL